MRGLGSSHHCPLLTRSSSLQTSYNTHTHTGQIQDCMQQKICVGRVLCCRSREWFFWKTRPPFKLFVKILLFCATIRFIISKIVLFFTRQPKAFGLLSLIFPEEHACPRTGSSSFNGKKLPLKQKSTTICWRDLTKPEVQPLYRPPGRLHYGKYNKCLSFYQKIPVHRQNCISVNCEKRSVVSH